MGWEVGVVNKRGHEGTHVVLLMLPCDLGVNYVGSFSLWKLAKVCIYDMYFFVCITQ